MTVGEGLRMTSEGVRVTSSTFCETIISKNDVSTEGLPGILIGLGGADSSGNFCVSVAPSLCQDQVILTEKDT